MAALDAAQIEISAIVSENRITAALNHNVPSSVNRIYEVGEEVLAFCEKEKNRTGPMVVVLVEDKIITVKNLESERVLRFSTQ
jgi:Reverse transcriptase (RNA-dependent DNA polymerase)